MYKVRHSGMIELVVLHMVNNVKETAAIMIEKHILIVFSKEICGQAFIIYGTVPY